MVGLGCVSHTRFIPLLIYLLSATNLQRSHRFGLTLSLRFSDFLLIFSLIDSLPAPAPPHRERDPLANPSKPHSISIPFRSYKCRAYPDVHWFSLHLTPATVPRVVSAWFQFPSPHFTCVLWQSTLLNDSSLGEFKATRICFSISHFSASSPYRRWPYLTVIPSITCFLFSLFFSYIHISSHSRHHTILNHLQKYRLQKYHLQNYNLLQPPPSNVELPSFHLFFYFSVFQ